MAGFAAPMPPPMFFADPAEAPCAPWEDCLRSSSLVALMEGILEIGIYEPPHLLIGYAPAVRVALARPYGVLPERHQGAGIIQHDRPILHVVVGFDE
jgi:hypothetical protein